MMRNIRHWLWNEVTSDKLSISLMLGMLIGLTEVFFAISMGSLLFSGELKAYLPLSIGIALFTGMIMLVGISIMGSVPVIIGTLQDSPNVIMVIVVSGLVSSAKNVGLENKLEIVLVTIAITTLLSGGILLLIGSFKLGGLVRFVPYPVIGGFIAGTGWLLAQGSFGVMADYPLAFSNMMALIQPDQILLWLPGLILALVIFVGLRRFHSSLVMPAILIGAVLVFYMGLLMTGTSIDQAVNSGLLLGELPGKMAWQPLNFKSLQNLNWNNILGQSGNIATILIISVLGLLLSASAVELATEKDLDLNRELRVAGVANLLSGLGGGLVGFQSVMLSVLAHRFKAHGRIVGLMAGAICGLMLFGGARLLTFFPRPILGGLLLYFGLDFLDEWVVRSWSKLSRLDYSVVILILIVIATTNFLMGVAVGLVATISLFLFSYSRIDVVRHSLSGSQLRSNVERLERQKQMLKKIGEHIYIMELQGYIFFGTANALLEQIKTRLTAGDQLKVLFIIFDFRRVTGLDSSAVFSFVKCRQIAEQQDIKIVLTDVPPGI
ncbi:MAG: SulP family inorganic anion transporter, partial [Anaerolineales bacterium]